MTKRVVRDRFGRPLKSKTRAQQPEEEETGRRRRRSFAGADTINVNCAPDDERPAKAKTKKKEKESESKFPWGTVLITGIVTTVGSIVAMRGYDYLTGRNSERQANPQQATQNARDMLLMTAPGAMERLGSGAFHTGPTEREMLLMEREAAARERLAELEGFMMAQQAAANANAQNQQNAHASLGQLLAAMEEEDDD